MSSNGARGCFPGENTFRKMKNVVKWGVAFENAVDIDLSLWGESVDCCRVGARKQKWRGIFFYIACSLSAEKRWTSNGTVGVFKNIVLILSSRPPLKTSKSPWQLSFFWRDLLASLVWVGSSDHFISTAESSPFSVSTGVCRVQSRPIFDSHSTLQ